MLTTTTAGFIVLATILNSTLYITKPCEADKCYITLDYNGEKNDSWPSRWISMEALSSGYCKTELDKEGSSVLIHHKVRYIYPNRSHWYSGKWVPVLYSEKNFQKLMEGYNNISIISITFACIIFIGILILTFLC